MKEPTGRYEIIRTGEEEYRAFVPDPLPPAAELITGTELTAATERAALALGRLDGAAHVLPNTDLLLYSCVRKEAVLSSQIEGTQSTLSDLLSHELGATSAVSLDDIAETSNYVAAVNMAFEQMDSPTGLPLCNRLLRDAHAIVLRSGRGAAKLPGEFRTSQNWIGGSRPGTARFVPPPPHLLGDSMSRLESFLHDSTDGFPALVRSGLAHVQFETIHPFLDGNGRVGRMLIVLALHNAGVLRTPQLYVSLHFKRHRHQYYELLDGVRQHGDWEQWLLFFMDAVTVAADDATNAARRLRTTFDADRARFHDLGRLSGSTSHLHDALAARPVLDIATAAELAGFAVTTATHALERLCAMGIAHELTGQRRNRLFAYTEYLDILSEGTEPL